MKPSITLLCAIAVMLTACQVHDSKKDLWSYIESASFVDLTHAFEPGIPHHPLLPDETRESLFTHEVGFWVEKFCHVGQWGTHVDPPVHFVENARPLDEITLQEMILPLVVINVAEQAEDNNDYKIRMEDISQWEQQHGPIPSNSFVAMRTDWSDRWPDGDAMQNYDKEQVKHYPGWSKEVLEYLIVDRDVTAIGHETTDTDRGLSTTNNDYSLEDYVLRMDKYQIELMNNLDKVPEQGAVVIATWPKVKNGSGFPARIIALVP